MELPGVKMDFFNDSFTCLDFGIFDNEADDIFFHDDVNTLLKHEKDEKVQKSANDLEIDNFLAGTKSKQTVYKETSDYNRFKAFLKEIGKDFYGNIEDIPAKELDEILCQFLMKGKKFNKTTGKYDGGEYQPDSLTSFRNSLQRVQSARGSDLDLKNRWNLIVLEKY